MSVKQVPEILKRIQAIHEKKNADYATDGNPFSNFERAATIASWFSDPVDRVFATLVGIKLARLAELANGKIPNNESIDDSYLDNCTYNILWMAYNQHRLQTINMIKDKELAEYNSRQGRRVSVGTADASLD